jgi:DtxR family Mn-dependent transcriptional regulator
MPNPLIALLIGIGLVVCAYGLLRFYPAWRHSRELTGRVRREDALKHIHKFEMDRQQPTVQSVAGILNLGMDSVAELLTGMERDNLLEIEQGKIQLTPRGRDLALHIIRAHRLWERYLAEETGYPEADWHSQAERHEHSLTPEQTNLLADQLGNPTHDPHGDPIPTAEGNLMVHGGQPLCSLPVDTMARIVHLEDEPEVVYAQLVAEGLYPGMTVRLLESNAQRVRFWAVGNEHVIAPIVALNISAKPLPAEIDDSSAPDQQGSAEKMSLGDLPLGETAQVQAIGRACRGAERRRFMDLGILPGTHVTAEMRSPGNDPTAYRIRGALIALRREQAELIVVSRDAS